MVEKYLEKLDIELIIAEVELLRPGHACTINKPSSWSELQKLVGGCNYHIVIVFDDGRRWVMRVRKIGMSYQHLDALRLNLDSEFATVSFMSEQCILIPKVWARPATSRLPTDLLYFYQEFVPGVSAFEVLLWVNPITDPTIKLIRSYAEYTLHLEKITFDRVGSLHTRPDGMISVGPLIDRRPPFLQPPHFHGPFDTAKQRYLAIIDLRLEQTLRGERYPPSLELLHYLILLDLRTYLNDHCPELEEGPWYIKHNDENGNHVMMEKDGTINGVIDWEWTYITCKAEAFAAPSCMLGALIDRDPNILSSRETALMEAYRALDRTDLAEYVKNGRKYHHLHRYLFEGVVYPKGLTGMRRAFLDIPEEQDNEPKTIKEWIRDGIKRHGDKQAVKDLVARRPDSKLIRAFNQPDGSVHKDSKKRKLKTDGSLVAASRC
nr:uncharacterized protein CI109_001623 [Kwoniella shandongensis]KAA5530216.1 hypothetical protein CI109_001623 [Kwoniella shandongensis]